MSKLGRPVIGMRLRTGIQGCVTSEQTRTAFRLLAEVIDVLGEFGALRREGQLRLQLLHEDLADREAPRPDVDGGLGGAEVLAVHFGGHRRAGAGGRGCEHAGAGRARRL